jgi:protein-S-isoprenylcysteine O-methyltransferase Ste14
MLKLPTSSTEDAPQTWGMLALKAALQTAVLWCVFLWALPAVLATFEARWLGWRIPEISPLACWIAFWAMGFTGFYCGMLFLRIGNGTPLPFASTSRFLVLGPYRFVRNPMALLGIGQGITVGLLLRSPSVVAFSLGGAVAWHLLARPWEEADLLRRFGQEYEAYQRAVRNWLPRLTPYPRVVASPINPEPEPLRSS